MAARTNRIIPLLIVAFILSTTAPTFAGQIIYVDADAAGANNGSSWEDAYNHLQDALANANSSPKPVEIQVAQSVYTPDWGDGITPGDREATFQLINGVTLKGGYAGFDEPDPDARDVAAYETILSGDLSGNDRDVNDSQDLLVEPTRAENSYHIVTCSGVDLTTLLDGFTITAGNADGPFQENENAGAGMFNDNSDLKLINCTFNQNSAGAGGGIYNKDGNPTLIDCIISSNSAVAGGGMYNRDGSNPALTNCYFNENFVSQNGGGMYNEDSNPTLTNCTFSGNLGIDGGGINNHYGNLILTDCIFTENSAWAGGGIESTGNSKLTDCSFNRNSGWGSGIAYYGNMTMTLTNCVFSGNSGSGMGGFGKILLTNCTLTRNGCGIQSLEEDEYGGPTLTNCILWGNGSEINWDIEPPFVNYCCIQGWSVDLGGTGNHCEDPLFVEPGYWDENGVWVEGDYHLLPDSPCIDAGDPNYIAGPNDTDLDGKPRVIGCQIDMGAYEFQGHRLLFVDDDAAGKNDGSSWADAYNYLQDALAACCSSDEIRVAQGIYTPDSNSTNPNGSGDREATLQLINGITLKGGYAGFDEPDPDARDVAAYETILSGDLAGDDGPDFTNNGDNSYHVVTCSGTDETTVLDGFTITAGNASHYSYKDSCGGGMYNWFSSPTVINCTFTGNYAGNDDGGGHGAGMYNVSGNPTVTNCKFIDNSAIALDGGEGAGGGIYNGQSNPTLTNCTFMGNTAGHNGGGMYNYESSPTLTNCAFSGNLAREGGSGSYGGGMYNGYFCNPTLTNCTFSGNTARADYAEGGGGIYNGTHTSVTLINCIFWANSSSQGSQIFLYRSDKTSIRYCDIQDGAYGVYVFNSFLEWLDGNIDVDPCFVKEGYWDENGVWVEGDYHLLPDSPCIDAGDPNYIAGPNDTDLDGKPRVICGRIDMGAYEFQGLRILFVDDDATGKNDGRSWADAYNYLQDALAACCSSDEIRVAQGIYKPDQGVGITPGDRTATFQLKNDVVIKGGYAGFSEPDPNARDIDSYETILSGDIGTPIYSWDNCYHTVTASGTDETAVIDGFTITGGCANVGHDLQGDGGGMLNDYSSPTVTNCTFSGNWAMSGGGMANSSSHPKLTNCTFTGNWAGNWGGAGLYNYKSSPTLTNCTFSRNSSGGSGGGMDNYVKSSPTLTNCTFTGNSAAYGGGMVNSLDGKPSLRNCIFSGNSASYHGGGIVNIRSNLTLTNCTFAGNAATNGNALGFDSYLHQEPSDVQITNCILWDGGDEIWNNDGSTIAITYSDIEGDWPGEGNIHADPCFVDSGYWDANGLWIDGDYHLLPDSPCIDAGDPNHPYDPNETDLDGKPRVLDGDNDGIAVVDMGAYEYRFAISAEVRIIPKTINLASKGNYITSYIWLPDEYDVADIEPDSIFLEDEIKPEDFSVDQQKQVTVLRFNREEVQQILEVGDVELNITGKLNDGTIFEATDTIKVTDKAGK